MKKKEKETDRKRERERQRQSEHRSCVWGIKICEGCVVGGRTWEGARSRGGGAE